MTAPAPGNLLRTAERAVRAGAAALAPFFARRTGLSIEEKAHHDFVSEADRASERAIAAAIRAEFPGHAILAEEELHAALDEPGPLWIVDPLDGTTNFLHGFPVFSVSIACAVAGELLVGVVLDPSRGELFAASRGGARRSTAGRSRSRPSPGCAAHWSGPASRSGGSSGSSSTWPRSAR